MPVENIYSFSYDETKEVNMQVGIIDDERADRVRITQIVKNALKDCTVSVYETAEEVIRNDIDFDLLLVDINLGKENGIDAVEMLETRALCIVYMTAVESMVRHAYGYHVAGYLFKSMDDSVLEKELKQIAERYLSAFITLCTSNGSLKIRQNQITWISAYRREILCHLKGGRVITLKNTTLKGCASLLDPKSFLMINRSEMINLMYISSIEDQKITMMDGTVVFTSRRMQPVTEKAWIRRFV